MKWLIATLLVVLMASHLLAAERAVTIEDFESGEVNLLSWLDEDIDPDAWELDSLNTFAESQYSLRLYGNTWKAMEIAPDSLHDGDVWSIACYVEDAGEIHGFGLSDGTNTLFYALDGSLELSTDVWVTADQGYYPTGDWYVYELPVAEDFQARFDYLPEISTLVFINNNDNGSGVSLFDTVLDITEDLPVPPVVTADADIITSQRLRNGSRSVEVQFTCSVEDPDSETHDFYWSFGDGDTSDETEPTHTYIVEDDHAYTALLSVCDDTGRWGYASCVIDVDEGETSLPLTINFVGDIMLARHYEDYGGIIPTQGVEAIFEPTADALSDADITVANLESPLTEANSHHPTKTIYFKGSPENVAGLTYAGIDIVSLANNHILDYMGGGIEETRATLDDAGVLHGGAGIDSYEAYLPVMWAEKGLSLAFCFSSDRTGQYNNYQPYLNAGYDTPGFGLLTPWYTLQQMEAVEDNADLTILNWHCGSEYSTDPGSNYDIIPGDIDLDGDEGYSPTLDVPQMWDRELRQFAIENGADAVICHHPHIIQGVEAYQGKLIAHSLGNFAFDLYYPETMPTMILQGEAGLDGFERWTIRPFFIDDYIPRPATGELGLHILDQIQQRSRALDTIVMVDRVEATGEVVLNPDTTQVFYHPYHVDVTLQQRDDWYVSDPTKLRNYGDLSSIDSAIPRRDCEVRVGREILWWGNMEDEGCTLWNLNSNYEDYSDEGAWRGVRSMKHQDWTGSDGVTTNQEDRLKCYADSMAHTMQGYIKSENSDLATMKIRFYNSRQGGYIDEEELSETISGVTDWSFHWMEFMPPNDTNYFDPMIYSQFSDEHPGPNWFDDISLVQWSDWAPISEMSEMMCPNDWTWVQVRHTQDVGDITLQYTEAKWNGFIMDDEENGVAAPRALLQPNYPNPFNPETTIRYSLPVDGDVKLSVYNIRGQLVQRLVDERQHAGEHQAVWRADGIGSGVYLYRLESGDASITRKMLLVK